MINKKYKILPPTAPSPPSRHRARIVSWGASPEDILIAKCDYLQTVMKGWELGSKDAIEAIRERVEQWKAAARKEWESDNESSGFILSPQSTSYKTSPK